MTLRGLNSVSLKGRSAQPCSLDLPYFQAWKIAPALGRLRLTGRRSIREPRRTLRRAKWIRDWIRLFHAHACPVCLVMNEARSDGHGALYKTPFGVGKGGFFTRRHCLSYKPDRLHFEKFETRLKCDKLKASYGKARGRG